MTNYANGDTGSDRAYDAEQEAREVAIDAKNQWIVENGPFETEEEADLAYDEWVAELQNDAEQTAHDEWVDSMEYWNPIEQGMYDDDPNPYHGDYSEM